MSTGWNSASREPSKVFAEDSRVVHSLLEIAVFEQREMTNRP